MRMLHHILTTWMEMWGSIKSSAQNKAVHMELSLYLSFLPQTQPRVLYGGHHHGIPSRNRGGSSLTISSSNPAEVPVVTYEYLFCPLSSDRLRPPTQWKARGATVGV
jgi:hypothetical protein